MKEYFKKRYYPQYERASRMQYKVLQFFKKIQGELRYNYDRSIRDTYGISFPRSGRHWMTIMLELYHGGPVFSDSFRDEFAARTHINSWVHGENPEFSGKRIIFIYRNPLDIMYSFHTYWATPDPLIPETRHYENDDPDITHVEARIKGWMEKWCEMVVKWVFEPPSSCKERLVLSYEQIAADTEGSLAKVVEFVWRRKAQPLRCKACAQAITKELIALLHPTQPKILKIHDVDDKADFLNKYRDVIISNINDKRIFTLYPELLPERNKK